MKPTLDTFANAIPRAKLPPPKPRVTGGVAKPTAGARSGVGRLAAAQRGTSPEGGVMRQRLRKDK